MPAINSIRQLRRDGLSIADIASTAGVSRDAVYKHLRQDDFSPQMPVKQKHPSELGPYRALIESWLDEDGANRKKQRHTYRRMHRRLVEECGLDVGESAVSRYVKRIGENRKPKDEAYLDPDWTPGEAQADFGEADFHLSGTRVRMHYFVLAFPYSNVGFARVLPGENAECVCEGPKKIFEYIGGVPERIVFDNATGIGRRVCREVRTTELFGALAAHYDFAYSFCNPASGNEKGDVEDKVGFIRRNLFAPPAQARNIDVFSRNLLGKRLKLSDKPHWIKAEPESRLFMEDAFALSGLPAKAFDPVRYLPAKANKQGRICLEGRRHYSSDPSLAQADLIVALRAFSVEIYTEEGSFVCEHRRAYGQAPTDTTGPESQPPLLCVKPGGWKNSKVRSSMGENLRGHLDSLGADELKAGLRLLRDECARSGWGATVGAARLAYDSTGRIDGASLGVSASRIAGGMSCVDYDDPIDLGVYDAALNLGGRWHGLLEKRRDRGVQVPCAYDVFFKRRGRPFPEKRHRRANRGNGRHGQARDFRARCTQDRAPGAKGEVSPDEVLRRIRLFASGLSRGVLERGAGGLGFVSAAQDFVFYGRTGRGKTHPAIAVGMKCVQRGRRVGFFTAAGLVMALERAKRENELEALLKDIAKSELLIIDELGYVPLSQESARLLFQVMGDCCERRSLVITTNIEFSKWGVVFGDDKLASALIDRIMHHGRLVEFGGASKRMENALMLGKSQE